MGVKNGLFTFFPLCRCHPFTLSSIFQTETLGDERVFKVRVLVGLSRTADMLVVKSSQVKVVTPRRRVLAGHDVDGKF